MRAADRFAYGDYQTPPDLARRVVRLLAGSGPSPGTVLEPTCGTGAFVAAALETFERSRIVACDVNEAYVARTAALGRESVRLTCEVADMFSRDWHATLQALTPPVLILGNPPWVTSAGMGAVAAENLPARSNARRRRGIEAITGASNFDVAEWLVTTLLEAARGQRVRLAMLVKTSVARRVLVHAWSSGLTIADATIHRFDASASFGVAADACLFSCRVGGGSSFECPVTELDRPASVHRTIGWRDGRLVSSPEAYDRHRSLLAAADHGTSPRWRSGIKHDCAPVMELRRDDRGRWINGDGARCDLEADYLYPLLKGTDLVRGRVDEPRRWLVVPQSRPGEDTEGIAARAPRTWSYLQAHAERLDRRRSRIYRNRPRFSVFGVGAYSFAPWKVAVSALHKQLAFAVVGPCAGRPVVLDDTCYHLSCATEDEARLLAVLLNADGSRALLESLIFWDAKRPITVAVLQRLDLQRVAASLGMGDDFDRLCRAAVVPSDGPAVREGRWGRAASRRHGDPPMRREPSGSSHE